MTALLLDEMLSATMAEQLRARGIDTVAVVEDPEMIGTADEDLLANAAAQQRVLVTANIADFVAVATDWRAARREHAGLIYVTNAASPHDRAFVGSVVCALHGADDRPHPGAETFLRRI